MSEELLRMTGINFRIGQQSILKNVNLSVCRGEIHGICGENGAGKSTLMKILSGVYPWPSYEGSLHVGGVERRFASFNGSEAAGIAIIFQEFTLVPQMTVAENIFLGREPARYGVIDGREMISKARSLMGQLGLDIDPTVRVRNLGVGSQQLVEIAKALKNEVSLLILDEPTAALTDNETALLHEKLKELKKRGVSSIYISHKLDDVLEITDHITVLRDGEVVTTRATASFSHDEMVSAMVGRSIENLYPVRSSAPGSETLLALRDWRVWSREKGDRCAVAVDSFEVRAGEVVGIAGLMGSGRTEFAMSLIGAYGDRRDGDLFLGGQKAVIYNPAQAMEKGLCYLTEDRKRYGLVGKMSIRDNMSLSNLRMFSNLFGLDLNKEYHRTSSMAGRLRIKASSIMQLVESLSGGNQQKVVLGKILISDPRVLFLDEPTRGIDIGAKFEIYNLINELAAEGKGVVIISSELQEVLGMSDRVYIFRNGTVSGMLNRAEATEDKLAKFMF